jgi:opacity protein-like surface antigen
MTRSTFCTARCLVVAAVLAASAGEAAAQLDRSTSKVGTTAAQFLKIGVGARAMGMGGAQAAMEGDISMLYWNAAALARMRTNAELSFNHASWLADINFDFAAGVMRIGDIGVVGVSVVSLGIPEDIVRTVDFPEGDGQRWDAGSLAIGATWAMSLTDRFSVGLTAKYVHESIWNTTATGFAIDIGTLYVTEIEGLSLGASISNFGTKMRLSGRDLYFNNNPGGSSGSGAQNVPSEYRTESFDMPLTFRIGVAYDILRYQEGIRWTAALDATHPNDNTEYVNVGTELAWSEIVFARIGYKSLWLRDSEQGLTLGAGVQYGFTAGTAVKFDYAYADYGRLKGIHTFSVGLTL